MFSHTGFIRTTHDAHGRPRPFPPTAWAFWFNGGGGLVGQIVRPETPLSFDEIVAACREAAFEYVTDGPQPAAEEGTVALCLVRLLEWGMVTAVPIPPTPPPPATWKALWPDEARDVAQRPASC
ncbi:MAG: hypothetical protein L0332_34765 [Chloroflexi bacterium]|nr:hypothetical protein [Chloroflexota bacterium]MCI0581066.1 hypothetical protein [Chloroflexota bacterium]MCI0649470.1 hypothetical protein [Chloroflexota bacterium]MCI0731859.1 hypothetical protein [Chloroflexota bacterium]